MTHEELNHFILHYLKEDRTNSAIMLTAPWGTGKSYYIQNELIPFLESCANQDTLVDQKYQGEKSNRSSKKKQRSKKCIVVSLYGIKTLDELSKELFFESKVPAIFCKKRHTSYSAFSKTILTGAIGIGKTVLKALTSIDLDFSVDNPNWDKLYSSVDFTGKLIILEDLERSDISITEILGYVNSLVEQDGVKVLLIANESEIIRREEKKRIDLDIQGLSLNNDQTPEQNKTVHVLSGSPTDYKRTKEKTVSDTVLFLPFNDNAIEKILHSFCCGTYEKMLADPLRRQRLLNDILEIMSIVKSFNLRSFTYGCQKTFDLFRYVDESLDLEFSQYLLCSNVAFALRLKESDNIQWKKEDGSNSKSLGTYKFPVLKVAFDYIQHQYCDEEALIRANDTYCRQREYENSQKKIRKQLEIIYQYYEKEEIEVSSALAEVTKNLESSDDISCGEFGKLADCLVAIHRTIGHNDEIARCRIAMIKRIEKSESKSLEDDLQFRRGLQMSSQDESAEFSEWINEMMNACKIRKQAKLVFDYDPNNAERFENEIQRDRDKYISNHMFAQKLDVNKLITMVSASSPSQIASIRNAFLDVYSFSNLKDFFEGDKEVLEELKVKIDELIATKEKGDKIVLLQLNRFSRDLQSFIDLL